MEAAIRSLSETLTGFLGVDASGAVTGDDDNEPALVTRLSAVAGAASTMSLCCFGFPEIPEYVLYFRYGPFVFTLFFMFDIIQYFPHLVQSLFHDGSDFSLPCP